MIYFDNAASSFPKPEAVIKNTSFWISRNGANPGRSGHAAAIKADETVYRCRKSVAELFGVMPENVVFTMNATHALNIAILGSISSSDHVLISDLEHNSVYRPVFNSGADFSVVDTSGDIISNMRKSLKPNTKAVIMTMCSNLTGEKLPWKRIARFAKENGLLYIADASQCAGSTDIKVKEIGMDILCAPGHKGLYGLQGSGVMILNGAYPRPLIYGGSGSMSARPDMPEDAPERYEAGTLSTPAIVSLYNGVEYIKSIGIGKIGEYERRLANTLYEELSSDKRFSVIKKPQSGILAFNINGVPSEQAALLLSDNGFCLRGGLHCSPLAHKKYGTMAFGALRASFGVFNSDAEVKKFVYFLKNSYKVI